MKEPLVEKREAEYGYRTIGEKAFRLQQWAERKEKRAFDALLNRLNVRRWYERVYEEGGEKLDRLRANARKRANAYHDRQRAKRRGFVLTCDWCGARWCPVPRAPGACWNAKTCGVACQRALWRSNPNVRERDRMRKNAARGGGKCWCGAPKPPGHGWRYCVDHSPGRSKEPRP